MTIGGLSTEASGVIQVMPMTVYRLMGAIRASMYKNRTDFAYGGKNER